MSERNLARIHNPTADEFKERTNTQPSQNQIGYSDDVQTDGLPREEPAGCWRALVSEKSDIEIEPVACGEQPHQQAGAANHFSDLERCRINVRS